MIDDDIRRFLRAVMHPSTIHTLLPSRKHARIFAIFALALGAVSMMRAIRGFTFGKLSVGDREEGDARTIESFKEPQEFRSALRFHFITGAILLAGGALWLLLL